MRTWAAVRSRRLKKNAIPRLGCSGARIRRVALGKVWRDFLDHEFLEEVGGGGGADAECCVFEGECSAAIVRRVVGIGDASSDEAAENRGIGRLPASVVALANDGHGDGVESAGALAARAFIEVARILFQERGENRAADEGAGDVVRITGAVVFCDCWMPATAPINTNVTGSIVVFQASSNFCLGRNAMALGS
jgi:hypothetical protein